MSEEKPDNPPAKKIKRVIYRRKPTEVSQNTSSLDKPPAPSQPPPQKPQQKPTATSAASVQSDRLYSLQQLQHITQATNQIRNYGGVLPLDVIPNEWKIDLELPFKDEEEKDDDLSSYKTLMQYLQVIPAFSLCISQIRAPQPTNPAEAQGTASSATIISLPHHPPFQIITPDHFFHRMHQLNELHTILVGRGGFDADTRSKIQFYIDEYGMFPALPPPTSNNPPLKNPRKDVAETVTIPPPSCEEKCLYMMIIHECTTLQSYGDANTAQLAQFVFQYLRLLPSFNMLQPTHCWCLATSAFAACQCPQPLQQLRELQVFAILNSIKRGIYEYYMKILHEYNDLKDLANNLLGVLAGHQQTTVQALYKQYEIDPED